MAQDTQFFTVNLNTLQLLLGNTWVDLTDAECTLLKNLHTAPHNRLDTPSLLKQLSLPTDFTGKRALGVRMVRLRKKFLQIGIAEDAPVIKSIHGMGYQLCVPLRIIDHFSPPIEATTPNSTLGSCV